MVDEPDTSEPNDGGDDSKLELPSLGFRRRKKKQGAAPVEEPSAAETPAEATLEPTPAPTPEPAAETPVEAEVPPPAPEPTPEPAAETPVEAEVPPPAEEPDDHTQVLPSAPEVHHDAHDHHVHDVHDVHDHGERPVAAREPKPAKVKEPRKQLTLPPLSAPIATVVAGVVVGLGIVGLTFISSRGCELVKGTSSCGKIGLLFLIAILVLAVLFGATLLRAWKIADPLNSSFLAVGLVAVITMLFFLNYIDAWWMVIVIPVISAASYLLSWYVTRTFIDTEDKEADEPVDVDKVGL